MRGGQLPTSGEGNFPHLERPTSHTRHFPHPERATSHRRPTSHLGGQLPPRLDMANMTPQMQASHVQQTHAYMPSSPMMGSQQMQTPSNQTPSFDSDQMHMGTPEVHSSRVRPLNMPVERAPVPRKASESSDSGSPQTPQMLPHPAQSLRNTATTTEQAQMKVASHTITSVTCGRNRFA